MLRCDVNMSVIGKLKKYVYKNHLFVYYIIVLIILYIIYY